MDHPIRIMLVDDSPHFLMAACSFLKLSARLEIVGTASNGRNALEQCLTLRPDLILLDINLGKESGLDLISPLKRQMPEIRVIVLTMHDHYYRAASMDRGADGFVHKAAMQRELVPLILQQMAARSEQEPRMLLEELPAPAAQHRKAVGFPAPDSEPPQLTDAKEQDS